MSGVVIIADDLTGANATAVLLARRGFRAATFLGVEGYDPAAVPDLDVVAISTDSRAIAPDEAYRAVRHVAEALAIIDVTLCCKRIDSTLRGNLGPEIRAVLDVLPPGAVAVVVPVFPSSGRVCIGDYLMVNQVPLERTDVAKDPKAPVTTSRVTDLIAKQFGETVGHIDLGAVLKGSDEVARYLSEHAASGTRVVVVDATTDEDIRVIAEGVAQTGLRVVSVDPGPFTAALAERLLGESRVAVGGKVMLTIGSVSNLTRQQVGEARVRYDPYIVEVDASLLVEKDKADAEIERAVSLLLSRMQDFRVIGVVTTSSESSVLNLSDVAAHCGVAEEDISKRICDGLAEITRAVLKRSEGAIGGVYTSGGDITVAVCRALGSSGIQVADEVLPLAVYGHLIGGPFPRTVIITKGGLVGDERALVKCIDYLLTKVSTEARPKSI